MEDLGRDRMSGPPAQVEFAAPSVCPHCGRWFATPATLAWHCSGRSRDTVGVWCIGGNAMSVLGWREVGGVWHGRVPGFRVPRA